MDYQQKQEAIQSEFFKGKCGGEFNSTEYPHVLKDEYRKENLYPDIVDNVLCTRPSLSIIEQVV